MGGALSFPTIPSGFTDAGFVKVAREPVALDGKKLADSLYPGMQARVAKVTQLLGYAPILATIVADKDYSPSMTYVKMKVAQCKKIGLGTESIHFDKNITNTDDVKDKIKEFNLREDVLGILLQHPVPGHIDEPACFDLIDPKKDVDGVTSSSLIAFSRFEKELRKASEEKKREIVPLYSAATYGMRTLLRHHNVDVKHMKGVCFGNSPILGFPMRTTLDLDGATITNINPNTPMDDVKEFTRKADIVIGALGKVNGVMEYIKADWIKPGAVLIDAGFEVVEKDGVKHLLGCIEKAAYANASFYTPVPGGIGPMTIWGLLEQTVQAAERRVGLRK